MDITGLKQFLVVARLEHLSAAAEQLHVAQPSLSRTIARLEQELGTPLFERGGRLRLNPTGKLFQRHVELSLGELEAGIRAVREPLAGPGVVRLAAETFLPLTAVLSAFRVTHPDAEVELHQLHAASMPQALRRRDVDLCVASQPLPATGFNSAVLHDEPVLLAAPVGHRLAGADPVPTPMLAAEPFVTTGVGHWQRRLLDQLFTAAGLTPRIAVEGDEPGVTQDLVAAGLGVALIPEIARTAATRSPVEWVQLADPACRRQLCLHWMDSTGSPPAVGLLQDLLTTWDWTASVHGTDE